MNAGRTLFAQVMDFVPWTSLDRIVVKYGGDVRVRSLRCTEQFRTMAFVQMTYRESLRDIEACLRARPSKLYGMGLRGAVVKSTLADANELRDWRMWSDLAAVLNHARGQPLFSNMAIQTGLILRTVFGLALRQTEGLIGSIIHSAGDRACSSRSFHARPARSNSDLAKVDAPSCWAPAIDCRQHGSEAEWSRRMAGRKAWNNKAPLMAQIAYRLGRSLWRDCR